MSTRSASMPARRRRLGGGLAAAVTLGALMVPVMVPASSAAVINDPPANGHSITVFPDRDYVNGTGWPDATPVTVELIRNGAVVGTATVTPADDLSTPGFDGIFDLNHGAGDPCWAGATPDVRGGDIVRVTDAAAVSDQTTTARIKVTQKAAQLRADTAVAPGAPNGAVVFKGTAADAAGGQIPAAQLEARIVADGEFNANGRKDLRVNPVYDSPTATTWSATITGLTNRDIALATGGESSLQWLGRNPGLEPAPEATIAEYFDSTAIQAAPGCPAPAVGPTTPDLAAASDSGSSTTDNITNAATPTFTGSSGTTGIGTPVRLYVDNVLNTSGTIAADGSYSLTAAGPLTDGVHSIVASEVNPATGVETRSQGALSVTVDTAGPATTITGSPAGPTRDPSYTFSASEAGAGFDCSMTTGADAFTACTSPKAYTNLAAGTYTFKARATDAAGNTGAAATAALTAPATAPAASLSPAAGLAFAATNLNTASAAQAVTLTNSGTAPLTISSVAVTGTNAAEFTETHTGCGTSLAPGASCQISVTFKPTASGTRTASLVITDNAAGSPHSLSLTGTGNTAPTVTSRTPAPNTFAVASGARTPVQVTFSQNITAGLPTTAAATPNFTLRQGTTTVASTVVYNPTTRTATLTPSATLATDRTYTVSLTSAIRSANGPITAESWNFTTGPRPTVASVDPSNGRTGVDRDEDVTVQFSENVQGANATSVTLKDAAGRLVPATVSYDARRLTATLNPSSNLAASTRYTLTVAAPVRDAAGNPITTFTSTFTTGTR